MKHIWLHFSAVDLDTEVRQLTEEGRDLSEVQSEIAALRQADFDDPPVQEAFLRLLDRAQTLPLDAALAAREPDDLHAIRALRPQAPALDSKPENLPAQVHGAWLGRAAGCLLGKPLEGFRTRHVEEVLRESGNLPLRRYLRSDDVAPGTWDAVFAESPWSRSFLEDRLSGMPEDDDMNYTVTGLAIVSEHGRGFSSEDVANFWLDKIPALRTCTAERVAYRNFLLGIGVPAAARVRNPYREWIGAQIRADFWGYINPGDPEMAAEMAWRDARISHVRNGIYGEMWSAAMVAAAFVTRDPKTIVEAGLAQIPAECRLAIAVRSVLDWREQGLDFDQAKARVHAEWDEECWHHFTHTISNAVIVTVGLLWGEGDFGLSICRAVEPLFDTDCNGATVGSIVGAAYGVGHVPEAWSAPIRDRLSTGVKGYEDVRISDLATKTLEFMP